MATLSFMALAISTRFIRYMIDDNGIVCMTEWFMLHYVIESMCESVASLLLTIAMPSTIAYANADV